MLSGYSWNTFDQLTLAILELIKPQHILDIGAGEGKYGRIIRQHGLQEVEITAIEYEAGRKEELLALGYNNVHSMSAMDIFNQPTMQCEVVILGDVIEHFRKSEGQDLLEFLNYRSQYILVITPEAMPMSLANFYEGHNSLWRPEAMRWHDLWLHGRCGIMHFYLLRGYLNQQGITLLEIQAQINQKKLMLPYDAVRQELCQLELHDTKTHDPIPEDNAHVRIYRPL